jgi:signal transduction histidine kinase/streptogramin lyase
LFPDKSLIKIRPYREMYPEFSSINLPTVYNRNLHFDKFGGLWYEYMDTIFHVDSIALAMGNPAQIFTGISSDPTWHNYGASFLESKEGVLYVVDWGDKVFTYDRELKELKPIILFPGWHDYPETPFLDTKGRVWTMDKKGEIYRFDLSEKSVECLVPTWSKLSANLVDNHYGISLEDHNGNLWTCTGGGGLLKISGKVDRFKLIEPSWKNVQSGAVMSRTEKVGGQGWFDREFADQVRPLLENPYSELGMSSDFIYPRSVYNLVKDSGGILWALGVESDLMFLYKIDPEKKKPEKVLSTSYVGDQWFGNPMFLDNQEDVWFSERYTPDGVNIYKYDVTADSLFVFPFPSSKGNYRYRFLSDWVVEKSGYMWLGAVNGVYGFDPETQEWKHFKADSGNPLKLSHNIVLSVTADPLEGDSILWVGTEGGGMNRLNVNDSSVTHFNTDNGLPNNVIYGIQPDQRGNLWLSSNYGLCLFNSQTYETQNFTTLDGLPHNEFNRYEYSKSEDAMLYFGGMGGLVYFDPEDFYVEGKEHDVVISSLMLFNKPVEFGDPDSGFDLPKPIEQCKELTFNPDADMVSFGFSLLDLTSPDKNKFRYQLEGLSDEWIEISGGNYATFTDLAPGSYTLKVVGRASDNLWSQNPTLLQIHVLAPWYATWWFRGLMIIAFLGWTYLFYRYRLQQLLRVERMRNRIAQDLHDEIGSTLSSVSLFSSVLKNALKEPDEKSIALLHKINSSTSEMMESMNDMVWSIKSDNDRFEHVINRMRAFAVNLCESKDVRLHFNADHSADRLSLGMELRKNIYLIFKEAVNNSFKYANANELRVIIEVNDSVLHILIEDDGVGFNQSEISRDLLNLGGNGLTGMKKRAKEIGAEFLIQSDNGTSIILKVRL